MRYLLIGLSVLCSVFANQSLAASITIVNNDGAGEGFFDTTSVSPVGGNLGTTLGQQRLNVFNKAVEILEVTYDIVAPIAVDSSFDPLFCTSSNAVLGQAGPTSVQANYFDQSAIPIALYNQQVGYDANPGVSEIRAQFNSSIDNNNNCLFGTNWYYGFDAPSNGDTSLLSVLLHELLHGMGFLSYLQSNGQSGVLWGDGTESFDPYTRKLKNQSSGQLIINETASQRANAFKSSTNLVWTGALVNAESASYSTGFTSGQAQMYAPTSYESGSSVSHFNAALSPNELMEPAYTQFLNSAGLATQLLGDIGWTLNVANTAPTLNAVGNQTLNEDTSISVALSASDSENDTLTYSVSGDTTSLGASISGSTLTLTPTSNYHGSGSLTISVSDGLLSDSEVISVTVSPINDAPTLGAIGTQTFNEDTSHSVNLVIADIDSGSVTVNVSSNNTSIGVATSGSQLTLTPAAQYSGSATITVSVDDGEFTATRTFSAVVTGVNDAPTLNAIAAQSFNEDSFASVAFSAADIDGDTLSYSTSTTISGLNVSVSGSSLVLTPDANINGSGSVTLTVSDGQLTAAQTFNVTINNINDAPTLGAIGSQTFNEDTSLTVDLVIADIDSSSLTVNASSDNASIGVATSGSQLTLTPAAQYSGNAIITVSVDDGEFTATRTFSAVVTGVNDAPTLNAISAQSFDEDSTATVTFSATDNNGDTLTYSTSTTISGLNVSVSGSSLVLTPDADINGSGTVTLTVSDGQLTAAQTFNVTINSINDAPTLGAIGSQTFNEDTSHTVNLVIADIDSSSLTVNASSDNASIGVAVTGGQLTLTPAAQYSGNATITVSVYDGEFTATRTFSAVVTGVNDAPTLNAIAAQSFNEDTTTSVAFSANDSDGDSLNYSTSTTISGLNISVSGSNLVLTPDADINGSGTVTLTVSDGQLTAAQTFDVTINNINDAPVLTLLNDITLDVNDGAQSFSLAATDVDGDTLTFSAVSGDSASVTSSVSGSLLTLTPVIRNNQSTTVTLTVSDGNASDNQVIPVTLSQVSPLEISISDEIGLSDTDLVITGGTSPYSALLTYNGSARNDLLDGSGANLTVLMPTSGAFAGDYTLEISDSLGQTLSATFHRKMRVYGNATPLLENSQSALLMIEGAPANESINLTSMTLGVALVDDNGDLMTTITAADDENSFNRATARIRIDEGISNADLVAEIIGLEASQTPLDIVSARTVTFDVKDSLGNPLEGATISLEDERIAAWGIASNVVTNSQGLAEYRLPNVALALSYSNTNSSNNSNTFRTNLTSNTPETAFSLAQDLDSYSLVVGSNYQLNLIIRAAGFDFSTQAPDVMIEFSDQSTLKLTEQSLSSSSAEYEFNYSLANVYPQSVKMSHPQADSAIEQTLTPTADSETLFLTLVDNSPAAVTAEGDSSASGAAGGALSWLLLGIISILIRRSEVRPAARTLVRAGARHCG